jgi:putative phosphoesterase
MHRIAVIADTHGCLPAGVQERIAEADEIWHLGDFCDAETLSLTRKLGPPVEAVLGNNDYGLDLPRHLRLERFGKSFFLIHIPPSRPGGADYLLHGHTHVPCNESIQGTTVLNPGSVGKANKGAPASFAWLVFDEKSSFPAWNLEIVARGT